MRIFNLVFGMIMFLSFTGNTQSVLGKIKDGELDLKEQDALLDLFKNDLTEKAVIGKRNIEISPKKDFILVSWAITNDGTINNIGVMLDLNEGGNILTRGQGPGIKAKIICKGIDGCSFCYSKFKIINVFVPYPVCECRDTEGGDCEMTIEYEVDISLGGISSKK
jgi:hypothetical protein